MLKRDMTRILANKEMTLLQHRLLFFLVAVVTFGLAPARAVDTPPADSVLVYAIERKGDRIGEHSVSYALQPDGETDIEIAAKIRVKFAFLTVYRLDHVGHELWQDGHLLRMTTNTLKNNERDSVLLRAADGHYVVETEDGERTAPLDLVPSSFTKPDFWIEAGEKRFLMLNTLTGDIRESRLEFNGREQLMLEGQAFDTRNYKVFNLERDALSHEFWVDDAGYLVRAHLVTKDGHSLYYIKSELRG